MLERYFDERAQARIADAVRRAEALSRGQIVPVVVEKSDAYPEVRYRGALLAAAFVTGAAVALRLPITLGELSILQIVAGLLGAALSLWDPVERALAGPRALDEAVRARAVRAFHEQGLHRTEEGTGVLLFASLFERQAVVLGDRGIDAKLAPGEWDRTCAALVAGLRANDPGKGFVDAIALCGARLAEHFPRDAATRPPVNELEDAIRISRT